MPDKISHKIKTINYRNRQKRSVIFIAIPLHPDVRLAIGEQIERLKKPSYPISWIDSNQAQIVLLTLGSLSSDRAEDALKAIELTASKLMPFSLNAIGLGYFAKERTGGDPTLDGKKKWIVYLDVPDKGKVLRSLYKTLFRLLASEGFFPPIHFNPRITLGTLADKRGSREQRENLLENLIAEEVIIDDFLVDRIHMYEMTGMGPKLVKSISLS